jgi:hypothetical protein
MPFFGQGGVKVKRFALLAMALAAILIGAVACGGNESDGEMEQLRLDVEALQTDLAVLTDEVETINIATSDEGLSDVFVTSSDLSERLDTLFESRSARWKSLGEMQFSPYSAIYTLFNLAEHYRQAGDDETALQYTSTALSLMGFGQCGVREEILESWWIPETIQDLIGDDLSPLFTIEELEGEGSQEGSPYIVITYTGYISGGC